MKKIVTLVFALVATSCWAQKPISDSARPSNYGTCIIRDGFVSGINKDECFAMHSVMKFPQALYVADYLSRKGLALDDTIVVDKADLMQDTWSPMLKRFEGKAGLFVCGTAGIVSRTERQQCVRTPFQALWQAQSGREVHKKTWIL